MPRISLRQLRQAYKISPLLSRLLPACRDLASAQNELRWLRDHHAAAPASRQRPLAAMCEERRRGVPLQYILGTQPFGNLDIQCGPGVLIPRPETEAYTEHLASLLRGLSKTRRDLTIVDFCTGTGCIPLLLYSLLAKRFPGLAVQGFDISPAALRLARRNRASAIASGHIPRPSPAQSLSFRYGDVLSKRWVDTHLASSRCDVLVSNPPYVSSQAWSLAQEGLSYSTRKYEPKLALVPGDHVDVPRGGWLHEDAFYAALLDIALIVKPSIVLFEFGGDAQGERILRLAMTHAFAKDADFELWRDYPYLQASDVADADGHEFRVTDGFGSNRAVPVRGSGNIRSLFIRKRGVGYV